MASGVGRALSSSELPGLLGPIWHMVTGGPQACHRELPLLMASGLWRMRSMRPHDLGGLAALARGSHDRTVSTNRSRFASWRLGAIETTGAGRASSHAARSGQG